MSYMLKNKSTLKVGEEEKAIKIFLSQETHQNYKKEAGYGDEVTGFPKYQRLVKTFVSRK